MPSCRSLRIETTKYVTAHDDAIVFVPDWKVLRSVSGPRESVSIYAGLAQSSVKLQLRDWKKDMKNAGRFAVDPGLKARRRVEQWIKSRTPSTRKGKALMVIGPIVIGPIVEHGVRALEEKGPELAAAAVEKAKEKLPVVGNGVRTGFVWTREKIQARRSKP